MATDKECIACSKESKRILEHRDKQIARLQEGIKLLEERLKKPEQKEILKGSCLKHSPYHNSECLRCREIDEKRRELNVS